MYVVIYTSKGGNTRRLAEVIAKAVGVQAQSVVDFAALRASWAAVEILFVGASLYGGKISGALRTFLQGLEPKQAGKVAVFGTSMTGKGALSEIKGILEPKGIPVAGESFQCKGSFLCFNPGRPNAEDMVQAEGFTRRVCAGGT
jgi:flavodoxin